MKVILITVPENNEHEDYIEKKLVELKGNITSTCKLISMKIWTNNFPSYFNTLETFFKRFL